MRLVRVHPYIISPHCSPAAATLSIRQMNETLLANNYLLVPELIDPARAAALAQEFHELERTQQLSKDGQAPNSPAIYNFLPFVRLMVEKINTVSDLCGEPMLPTYVYGRIYKHGEVLVRHRDRDACEVSISLNLAQDADWHFGIRKPGGEEIELLLRPGDGILYLGCEADHWRGRFAGTNYQQIFMHYVRAHGPRAYTFFDRAKVPLGAQHRPVENPSVVPHAVAGPGKAGTTVGRNDPCPCGSGRKYKRCHGNVGTA